MQAVDKKDCMVFLVEDDEAIAHILELIIVEEVHCRVMHFTHATSALDAADGRLPDLLILDYQLPDISGLTCYDLFCQRQNTQHIPALMLSANLPYQELEKRHIQGLAKPFDLTTFMDLLQKLLNKS